MFDNKNQIKQKNNFSSSQSFTEILALVCAIGSTKNTVICEKGVAGVCGSCSDKKDGCVPDVLASNETTLTRFEVHNTYKAQVGDVVRISIAERSIWLSIIVSYVMPLLGLLIGASGASLISYWIYNTIYDLFAIVGAFVGLSFGIAISYLLATYLIKEVWAPKMLGVLGKVKPCSESKS